MTKSETIVAKPTDVYLSLKVGRAKKTGVRSKGYIHYRLLCDPAKEHLYVTIVANDSGGAYSREILAFNTICSCLEGIDTRKPIASKLFQKAFIGKSANNAGFLAAILWAEQLLEPAPDAIHQHIVKPEWTTWKTAMLALAVKAESYQPEPPKLRSNQKTLKTGAMTKNNQSDLQASQLQSTEPKRRRVNLMTMKLNCYNEWRLVLRSRVRMKIKWK